MIGNRKENPLTRKPFNILLYNDCLQRFSELYNDNKDILYKDDDNDNDDNDKIRRTKSKINNVICLLSQYGYNIDYKNICKMTVAQIVISYMGLLYLHSNIFSQEQREIFNISGIIRQIEETYNAMSGIDKFLNLLNLYEYMLNNPINECDKEQGALFIICSLSQSLQSVKYLYPVVHGIIPQPGNN